MVHSESELCRKSQLSHFTSNLLLHYPMIFECFDVNHTAVTSHFSPPGTYKKYCNP